MSSSLGLLAAFGHALAYAGTNVILRRLSTRLDPFLINGLRALAGLAVVLPVALIVAPGDYALITGQRFLYLAGSMVITGVLGSAAAIRSLQLLGVGRAFPISNSYPLFTLLFTVLILGDPVPWRMVPGALLVLAGVYAIARSRLPRQKRATETLSSRQMTEGVVWALIASLCWSLSSIILAKGMSGLNSIVASSVRIPVVTVVSLFIFALRGKWSDLRLLDGRTALLLAAAGVVGFGISSSLYVAAIKLAGPSMTSIVATTSPLFAVPLSFFFLRELPNRFTLLGTVLVVVGLVVVL